jgi:hypothetical protein
MKIILKSVIVAVILISGMLGVINDIKESNILVGVFISIALISIL